MIVTIQPFGCQTFLLSSPETTTLPLFIFSNYVITPISNRYMLIYTDAAGPQAGGGGRGEGGNGSGGGGGKGV